MFSCILSTALNYNIIPKYPILHVQSERRDYFRVYGVGAWRAGSGAFSWLWGGCFYVKFLFVCCFFFSIFLKSRAGRWRFPERLSVGALKKNKKKDLIPNKFRNLPVNIWTSVKFAFLILAKISFFSFFFLPYKAVNGRKSVVTEIRKLEKDNPSAISDWRSFF